MQQQSCSTLISSEGVYMIFPKTIMYFQRFIEHLQSQQHFNLTSLWKKRFYNFKNSFTTFWKFFSLLKYSKYLIWRYWRFIKPFSRFDWQFSKCRIKVFRYFRLLIRNYYLFYKASENIFERRFLISLTFSLVYIW